VYRLICKGTVEEKIVKRASQKNTVQQLVMTGGQSVQGDVLEAEEVVSLLLDDAELEARMREQNSKQVVGFSLQDLLTCVLSLQFLLAS
jgi:DNA helicase INO80